MNNDITSHIPIVIVFALFENGKKSRKTISDIKPSTTIRELKVDLSTQFNIPINEFKLVVGGLNISFKDDDTMQYIAQQLFELYKSVNSIRGTLDTLHVIRLNLTPKLSDNKSTQYGNPDDKNNTPPATQKDNNYLTM